MFPEEGNKTGGRAGRHVLCGMAEDFGFVWVGEKEAEGRPHCSLQLLRRGCGEGGADLFSLGSSDTTHGNASELHQGSFRLDVRKHFFTERVVKHWNRLPRELVDAPSLSV